MILYCVLVTFPCGVLGQVWCLIVSIPDLCLLSYFYLSELRILLFTKIYENRYPKCKGLYNRAKLKLNFIFNCDASVIQLVCLLYLLSSYEKLYFLHTGWGYLRFYPGIENLILPMLSYPGRQVTSSSCEIASKRIRGLLEAYFEINK